MSIKFNKKETAFLAKCEIGTSNEVVANRFTGEKRELCPEAVAIHDTILGAEMLGAYGVVREGLAIFRKHWPEEYMVLLD